MQAPLANICYDTVLTSMQGGWFYILTNKPQGTLYIGVTADLPRRLWQHRSGGGAAFTARYQLKRLVHAEHHESIIAAIQREKNLKHWPRAWKVALIERDNPGWDDLYDLLANG
jgi:putative endonuclease